MKSSMVGPEIISDGDVLFVEKSLKKLFWKADSERKLNLLHFFSPNHKLSFLTPLFMLLNIGRCVMLLRRSSNDILGRGLKDGP